MPRARRVRRKSEATVPLLPSALNRMRASAMPLLSWPACAPPDASQSMSNALLVAASALALIGWLLCHYTRRRVYLMDYSVFVAPMQYIGDVPLFESGLRKLCSAEAVDFMVKLVKSNGLGQRTAAAPGMFRPTPDLSHQCAREELELVMFDSVDAVFAKTGLRPCDIDIVVTNCSLFNPIPSMASALVHHYGMRTDVDSYHLGGMGCSANVIAMTLVADLLRARPNARALVFSTETISPNVYLGEDRSFLLANTLFRMGGSAQILSNRADDLRAGRCRYELELTLRTTLAANDEAYRCVFQDIDAAGRLGVRLDKNLVRCAARTLKQHLITLGPKVLPIREQLRYALELLRYKWSTRNAVRPPKPAVDSTAADPLAAADPMAAKAALTAPDATANAVPAPPKANALPPPPVPNFGAAVQHFCIHAGGRAVIDGIQQALGLTERDVVASRAVLRDIGNVSSSSIWYEFAYVERGGIRDGPDAAGWPVTPCTPPKRGERVWQIAFGSGFKTNSSVWRRL